MNNNKYKLIFDFLHDGNNLKAFFKNPLHIITTKDPKEVASCLERIDQAINEGYYVAGYMAYEAAAYFYPEISFKSEANLPLLWFGLFKEKLKIPHTLQDSQFTVSTWEPVISRDEYNQDFSALQGKIISGEMEQINYTIRMGAQFSGDDYAYYQQLAKAQESNYSAYLRIDHYSILSASPELFFHIKDRKITTKPMKGTVSRAYSYEEDKIKANWLKNSEKNQRENLVSVHLMKEELKEIAKPNSINVPIKFEIEQYPTVFQMTSTVTADLKDLVRTKDIFKSLFPSSSITGFPKVNTMKIINKYEKDPRFIYCGALGYFTPDHEAIFNVPIRTVYIDQHTNRAIYGVGGAIMEDSTSTEEYEEIIAKARILTKKTVHFHLLETIALKSGEYILLENHLERLKQSARYFNFKYDEEDLKKRLEKIRLDQQTNKYMVRVLLKKSGHITIEVKKLRESYKNTFVKLAKAPIQIDTPFIFHKTTNREMYEQLLTQGSFDTLLWNDRGEVTEFTKGNIVVKIDGEFLTPPISSGLLPGTFRKSLLEQGKIKERVILKEDLSRSEAIYFINSVREWLEVKLI